MHGNTGCYLAIRPPDARTGGGSAEHFLDRSVSGRLCQVKGQGFECRRAEATGRWVLKFPEVQPDWIDKFAELRLSLALAVGEQQLDSDFESLRLKLDPPQLLDVLVNVSTEVNGTRRWLSATGKVTTAGDVEVMLWPYRPPDIDRLTLHIAPLLADSKFDTSWELAPRAQISNESIRFAKCQLSPFLEARFQLCGRAKHGWTATVASIPLDVWRPELTSLTFSIVPKSQDSETASWQRGDRRIQILLRGCSSMMRSLTSAGQNLMELEISPWSWSWADSSPAAFAELGPMSRLEKLRWLSETASDDLAAALIMNLSGRFPSLQELEVTYTITSRAKDALAEGMEKALNTSSLRVLHLTCHGPAAAMAAAVGQISAQLEELRLEGRDGVRAFIAAFPHQGTCRLKKLNVFALGKASLELALSLAKALRRCHDLQEVQLDLPLKATRESTDAIKQMKSASWPKLTSFEPFILSSNTQRWRRWLARHPSQALDSAGKKLSKMKVRKSRYSAEAL